MPAPDLTPPPPFEMPEKALHVHLHAKLVTPQELAGGVVVVIDNLRASVTMTAALFNGASAVVPVLTVEDAARMRETNGVLAPDAARGEPSLARRALMGGERGGVLIPGFDLDNSPRAYSRERVEGRTIIFTTVNGTAALLQSRLAARVIVGSFANLSAVCECVARDPRPVHLLCCGTREEISLDDVLPAGAMAQRLITRGRNHTSDDSARLAIAAYEGVAAGGLLAAMRASRGGRNLERIGLGLDVEFCSRLDTMAVVPEFDGRRVTLAAG